MGDHDSLSNLPHKTADKTKFLFAGNPEGEGHGTGPFCQLIGVANPNTGFASSCRMSA